MKRLITLAAATMGALIGTAATWYVDDDNFGKGGLDGKSPASAWGTLQDAHDNAAAGDTVYVLPGTYDRGMSVNTANNVDHTNRLSVTKKLYFRATDFETNGNRTSTIIAGRLDPNTGVNGPAAIRCVFVASSGAGTQFHGFTIRDGGAASGSCDEDNSDTGSPDVGGALYAYKNTDVYLVDCDILNSWGSWGGGMRGGTAVRCLFDNCGGMSFGQTCSGSRLSFCVIKNNHSIPGNTHRPVLGNRTIAVNCTLAFCEGYTAARGGGLYNCVLTRQMSYLDSAAYPNFGAPTTVNLYGTAGSTTDNILAAPAINDFRLVSGTPAVGGGETLYVTNMFSLPAGIEIRDFKGRLIDLSKTTCDAGAVQGAITPVGGVLMLDSRATINGYDVIRYPYLHSVTVPEMVAVRPSGAKFLRYNVKEPASYWPAYRYADLNGTVSLFLPAASADVIRMAETEYTVELWCDPTADATLADGSETHPFRTLQAAMDHITMRASQNDSYIVRARPGEYAEGGAYDNDHTNRVVIPGGPAIVVKSTGGPAVTAICGKADPNAAFPQFPGCGSAAMRCVSFSSAKHSNRALQGFTLSDGHSNAASAGVGATPLSDVTGGVIGSSLDEASCQILDCVISNCTAVSVAVGRLGSFVRCQVQDCRSGNYLLEYCKLRSCLLDASHLSAGAADGVSCSLGDGVEMIFTTLAGGAWSVRGSSSRLFGTVFDELDTSANVHWGSLAGKVTNPPTSPRGLIVADPCFADAAMSDWRVSAMSSAVSGLTVPQTDGADRTAWLNGLVVLGESDLRGNPIRVTNGVPMAGCFQNPVHGLYVKPPTYGGVTISGGHFGVNEFTDDLFVTLTANGSSASRPCIGLVVGGVTNLFATSPSVTVSAAQIKAAGGDLAIETIYTSDWYVSATGNDVNTGFTPETAKKTLSVALANECLLPGDVVHVAAGRYDYGVSTAGGVRCRANVPSGVTLVGEGVGATFIVGEKDVTVSGDADGFGSMAVRGVRLETGASVKNLTIADCWTEVNGNGAGVFSAEAPSLKATLDSRASYLVSDCLITNCWASSSGGGAYAVRLVRCKLFDNRAKSAGGSTYYCELYGSITDRSYQGTSNTASANTMFVTAVQSTLGNGNWYFSDKTKYTVAVGNSTEYGTSSQLKNCIVVGAIRVIRSPAINCVYTDQQMGADYEKFYATSRKATVGEMALDATYCPRIGKSVAIDFGDNAALESALAVLGDADILGTQRVYNGTVDSGAVEADWREIYARDIVASRRFAVVSASPEVVETNAGTVSVGSGGMLSATWTGRQVLDYTVTVRVSGTSAKVRLGDDERVVLASAAAQTLTFSGSAQTNLFVFDNTGNDGTLEILDSRRLSGMVLFVR